MSRATKAGVAPDASGRAALVPEPLTISRIIVDRFGGWRDRSVELPDGPLVVIHGPNEAGKSTLAELLLWLLVGPTGTAQDAQRFGARGTVVGGQVRGWLGVQEIESSGAFKVLQNGAPNDKGLSVVCGGEVLDADGWRRRLGGVDQQVFAAVYRLWGEQLHVGASVEDQLSKVALAAYGGRVEPRQLADELEREVRRWSSGRAAGVGSVSALNSSLAEVDSRLLAARSNADDHRELVRQIESLEGERAQLSDRRRALAERQRVIEVALEVAGDQAEVERLTRDLASIENEPASWASLVDDPQAVRIAAAAVTDAERELARTIPLLEESCQELHIDADRLADVAVTDADVAAVAATVERRRQARERLVDAERALDEVESELAARRERTGAAIAALGGPGRAELEGVRSGPDDRARLTSAVDRWAEARELAVQSEAGARRADTEAQHVADESSAAETAWIELGLGVSPESWLAGGDPDPTDHTRRIGAPGDAVPGPAAPGAAAPGTRPWWLAAAVVSLAVPAALVAGQPLAGLVAALLAVAVALLTRPASRPDGAGVAAPDPGTPAAGGATATQTATQIAGAAEAVVAARRRSVATRDEVARRSAAAEEAEARVAAAVRQLQALERELSIDLRICDVGADDRGAPADPASVAGLLRAWWAAIDAHAAERASIEQQRAVAGALERCRTELDSADRELRAALRGAGIAVEVPLDSADIAVRHYRVAVERRGAVENARERLAGAVPRWEALVRPVFDQVSSWRRDRVVEEAERLAEVREARRHVDDELRSVAATVEARLGGNAAVRAAAAEPGGEIALRAESVELAAELVTVAEAMQHCSERLGELRHRAEALEAVDLIGALALERGSLVEQRDDAAIAAATAAMAERLLRSVVDEYERRHQPTLVARTEALACSVAGGWQRVMARPAADGGRPRLFAELSDGRSVPAEQLSTGGRALLYLALRVAMAEHDARTRHVALPLICDDPVVHLDDERAHDALAILRQAAQAGHQVLLFTCHQRTVAAAQAVGAAVVDL